MRILMLAHRIPYPPHTGDKVRAYHIARGLAARHDLTLGFLVDDAADSGHVEALRKEIPDLEFARVRRPWTMMRGLAALAAGQPFTLGHFWSRHLQDRITTRVATGRYDLVYVSSSSMAQYAEDLASTSVLVDLVDVDSDKWKQYALRMRSAAAWLYRMEARRLGAYEGRIAGRAALCLLATRAEESLLRSSAPWARTAVVPNGVDIHTYRPFAQPCPEPTMIFTGAMDYLPNIDAMEHFCVDIYPRIRQVVPEAKLLIVGLKPAARVRRLAALPGVTVTGSVPDVRPYYRQAAVCVAPLRIARGVQNKVLQAMAMGLPVVATPPAIQGLEADAVDRLLVAPGPAEFAACASQLLGDPAARAALGGRARAFAEARCSWESSLAKLESLIAGLLVPPSPALRSAT